MNAHHLPIYLEIKKSLSAGISFLLKQMDSFLQFSTGESPQVTFVRPDLLPLEGNPLRMGTLPIVFHAVFLALNQCLAYNKPCVSFAGTAITISQVEWQKGQKFKIKVLSRLVSSEISFPDFLLCLHTSLPLNMHIGEKEGNKSLFLSLPFQIKLPMLWG